MSSVVWAWRFRDRGCEWSVCDCVTLRHDGIAMRSCVCMPIVYPLLASTHVSLSPSFPFTTYVEEGGVCSSSPRAGKTGTCHHSFPVSPLHGGYNHTHIRIQKISSSSTRKRRGGRSIFLSSRYRNWGFTHPCGVLSGWLSPHETNS